MYDHLTRLQKHHYQGASKLLAESFIDNPLFIYLFPNEKERERILLNIYRGVVEIVDAISDVYITSEKIEGIFAVRRTGKQRFSLPLYRAILKTILRSIVLIKDVPLLLIIKKAKKLSIVSQRMAFYEHQKPHLY